MAAKRREKKREPAFSVPRAVEPRPVPPDAELTHPHLYFNRELSWIDFNWRVLHQAMSADIPLLERVRFVSIAESNLDEFVRKRVGGLKRQQKAGVAQLSPDGRTPAEQLELIRAAVSAMQSAMSRLWGEELRPLLASEAGVEVVAYADLTAAERERLHEQFRSSIYPILTPLAVDPGHPFPFISNLSLSLAIMLRHPTRESRHFARVKVPSTRTRWVPVDESGRRFLPLEALIAAHTEELFRGMVVEGAYTFRVTRNADLQRDEEEAEDLLEMISEELRERRFAPVVRLEVEASMPRQVRELLCRELELDATEIEAIDGMLGLTDVAGLADLDIPAHRYPPWEPVTPPPLVHAGESEDAPDIFSVIRAGDVLVHHPYESFTASVQRFIEESADDPKVLGIKQTLYRTSENSPVVQALMRAAEAGKQVAVLVEVTARFDERNNIEWAQMLEKSGVHVTYGLLGLKTHSKVTLVVREEEAVIRAYCHIGTGNYHSRTARLYTDLGLLTCDAEIGGDVVNLFHYLTGHAPEQRYERLIVAPRDMRRRFLELVEREIGIQQGGGAGRIVAKMNALDDVEMIEGLYRASRAGVRIELIIRGHCRLRPGLPGISDNIRVLSIIGRFLEHDRIFYFGNGGDPEIFIGSADWRRRNLDERVEAVVQVREPSLMARLEEILETALADNARAWDLDAEGSYRLHRPPGEELRDLHEVLMQRARRRRDEADPPWEIEPGGLPRRALRPGRRG